MEFEKNRKQISQKQFKKSPNSTIVRATLENKDLSVQDQFAKLVSSLTTFRIKSITSLSPTPFLYDLSHLVLILLKPYHNRDDWVTVKKNKNWYWKDFLQFVSAPNALTRGLKQLPKLIYKGEIPTESIEMVLNVSKKIDVPIEEVADLCKALELAFHVPVQYDIPPSKRKMLREFFKIQGKKYNGSFMFDPLVDMQCSKRDTSPFILQERNLVSRENSPISFRKQRAVSTNAKRSKKTPRADKVLSQVKQEPNN